MLTAFQCEIAAYVTENGELLCPECFESSFETGDDYAKPLIRYSLDEWQTGSDEGFVCDDYTGEGDTCGCESALLDEDGHELVEAYTETFEHKQS
jgi:hypothetical protein